MKRSVLLIILAISTILALSACVDRSSGSTDTTDGASTSEPVTVRTTPESSQTSILEIDPTDIPTPTAAVLPFAFDLTDEEITETESPLFFIACMENAVVVGGEESPYTKTASFVSDYEEYDWFETGIENEHCQYSIDRTEVVYCSREYNETGKLVYYDGINTQEVASNVESYSLSLTGNAIAYTVWSDDTRALYMYDCETWENRLICDDMADFCVSPSGDTVAYGGIDDALYIVRGDAVPEKVMIDGYLVGVSNGGELVYYTKQVKDKWTLYVYTDGVQVCLAEADSEKESTSSYCDLIFNRDLTQVLIGVNNKLLLSKDGSEAVFITEISDDMNAGDSSAWPRHYSDYNLICRSIHSYIRSGYISYLPAKNLCNQLYLFADTLLYLDSNLDIRYLSSQTPYHAQESSRNGYQLAYLVNSQEYDGNDLYYMADFRESGTESKVPIEYVEDVVTTKNQSMYIENDIGQLYVVYGSNSPLIIDTYVDLIGQYEVEGITYIYYTKETYSEFSDSYGDDLYCMEDVPNSEPHKVASEIVDVFIDYTGIYTYEVSTIDRDEDYVYYRDIKYSQDGCNFSFLSTREYGT